MDKSRERKSSSGLFITFEGPEGSGKSTQIKLLKDFCETISKKAISTREPGGTSFGDKIRNLLLDHSEGDLEPETELFLMLAQRSEHLRKIIIPEINAGNIVLCDRYFDSSMAYQGYGRGLPPDSIYSAHKSFLPDFEPDITILLCIAPKEGLERARHGGTKSLDRMESENLSFHKRVFEGYKKLAADNPSRFIRIDVEGSPEEIFEKVKDQLTQHPRWKACE